MFTINEFLCTVTDATLFNDLDPGESGVDTFTLSSNAAISLAMALYGL